jgi:hypothetical protein
LEPVFNILVSMAALNQDDETSGLSDWVLQTTPALPPDVLQQNQFVFWGIGVEPLSNVAPPGPAREDFLLYLEHLATLDATVLRDELLFWKIHSAGWRTFADSLLLPEPAVADVLADPQAGIASLKSVRATSMTLRQSIACSGCLKTPFCCKRRWWLTYAGYGNLSSKQSGGGCVRCCKSRSMPFKQ